ncbi:MAG: tripartite tricarboxylate transporter substrate binding protein [Hyphomicrobiaceae bacterium]|nr:tripartite tricarboxylate transporter substrate binding protein [Hyphomicrobiaceae bacterium]
MLAFFATTVLALLPVSVCAQEFPTKPIRLVVPYPPGGPTDLVGRTYAAKMQEQWGQPVVVENRSGANGNIASQLVAKAPGDGYTLLLHASSFIINPLLYKSPGYDPFTEFTPISLVFDYKLIVVVHPSFPVNSIQELVAAAKAKPGSINFASAGGVGAPTHLSVEMFKQRAGIDLVHVPYQGGAPAVNDLLAGHVQLMFNNPTQSLQYIKAGKLRALATTGTKRSEQMPELPTVAELGYPDYDVGTWFGFWGPAGVPPQVVEKINAAVVKASAMPDVQQKLKEQGLNVIGSSAAELAKYQKDETERWGAVIKAAGIKLD